MSEPSIIIAGPPADAPAPVPDCESVPCCRCKGKLWLTEEQFKMWREHPECTLICFRCAVPEILRAGSGIVAVDSRTHAELNIQELIASAIADAILNETTRPKK